MSLRALTPGAAVGKDASAVHRVEELLLGLLVLRDDGVGVAAAVLVNVVDSVLQALHDLKQR